MACRGLIARCRQLGIVVFFQHVFREYNTVADAAAGLALRAGASRPWEDAP